MNELKRGSIFWAKLPILGEKDRPAIIISNDSFNEYSDMVTVLPFSTSVDTCVTQGMHRKVKLANRYCQTLPEYICTIDKSDVSLFITKLDSETMNAIMLDINTHFGNAPTIESSEILKPYANALLSLPHDLTKFKLHDKQDLLRIWNMIENSPVDQYLLANQFANGDKDKLVSLLAEVQAPHNALSISATSVVTTTDTNKKPAQAISPKTSEVALKTTSSTNTNINSRSSFSYELDKLPETINDKYPNKIITSSKVRWSYAHVWEPTSVNGGTPKYSLTVLIPKDDVLTIGRLKTGIVSAYLNDTNKLAQGGELPKLCDIKLPVRDGDMERPSDPDYRGCWFINTTSSVAPGIVDINRQPITDHSEVYSGVYGRVSISFYAFAKESADGTWAKGIACGLCNLQKVSDGELLGIHTYDAVTDFK